jgi:hypothetical protein
MQQVGSGVFVFVFLVGFTTVVQARPRRQVCETWRDYYYNVATGEFIEWASDPYPVCYEQGEPRSRPENPHIDYGGGWGTPRDPREQKCKQCARAGKSCVTKAENGTESCLKHYRKWARSWCERHKTDIDNRLVYDFKCEKIDEGPHGKPVMKCHGKGIDKCADSYEKGSPTSTSQSTIKVNIGSDWFGAGVDHSSSVTWGGRKGFHEGCRDAEREAVATCAAQQTSCQEDAGGCKE